MSEYIAGRVWPGALIERSIFGTGDGGEIWEHVLALCPDAVDCFAFEVSVGARLGLRLADGTQIALKVHAGHGDQTYLEALQQVQQHLWECGFPCPRPLGVRPGATLEEWCDDGVYLDAHDPNVRRVIAEQLARLCRLTAELHPLRGMEPYFAPAGAPLWPKPHNVLFDFEATANGAEWIDEIAAEAKIARNTSIGNLVIGHGDWTVKHFRFDGLRPTVIYDWDSLNTDYETVFAGCAAASFTYTEHLAVPLWPTVEETYAFIEDYERERGVPFTSDERNAARAAAVYNRAYGTRCTHAISEDITPMRLREYAEALLA